MQKRAYDIVVRNARIVDGTGGAEARGDLAVEGDRIVQVGAVAGDGRQEIDACGAIVAPGFIDVHTHDDRLVLQDPGVAAKVSQGVTTVVTGNCGISLAPAPRAGDPPPPLTLLGRRSAFAFEGFSAYLDALRRAPPALNVTPLVGHTSLRAAVMEDLARPADAREAEAMAWLLDEALEAGAFGLTTGLYYPPASAADTGEVEALLARVAEREGVYTTHVRDEGDRLIESLREALAAARRTGVGLVISHLKCASPGQWGRSGRALALIEEAARSQEVAFDVYPYEASSTMLRPDRLAGARRVVVSWSDSHPDKAGQDLADIAGCWCCSPEEAARRLSPGGAIYYKMQERDVRRILAHPLGMIGSDGLPHDVHPHPRLWGTFPRVLGRYVRELGILSLPEAVRKMTSLPARVFGLEDRGVLRTGAFADLVVFDPDQVIDEATYEEPVRASRGVALVLVNGRPVWRDGRTTGERSGRVLQRSRGIALSRTGGRRTA